MRLRATVFILAALVAGIATALVTQADPPQKDPKPPRVRKRADANEPADSTYRVPVATARERASQMHLVLESTLHSMHRHYFHRDRDRATVPARAMQDVFADVGRETHVDVRWISVNTAAMGIDHEPQDDFEKLAAKEIAAGKESFERVENGSFRRAGAIPLGAGCLNCHVTASFSRPSTSPKYAGLVISVPVAAE